MLDENADGFYVVLPSNVPNMKGTDNKNKTSNYKTMLPRAIQVHDRRMYECALVEICFPQSWTSGIVLDRCTYIYRAVRYYKGVHDLWVQLIEYIRKNSPNAVSLKRREEGLKRYLRDARKKYVCTGKGSAVVGNMDDLVSHLNAIRPASMRGKFFRTDDSLHLGVQLHRFESIEIIDKQLADLIEFPKGVAKFQRGAEQLDIPRTRRTNRSSNAESQENGNDETSVVASSSSTIIDQKTMNMYLLYSRHYTRTPNKKYYAIQTSKPVIFPPMSSNIYVYSDVVSETYVGHQYVPLLRTVPIKKENQNKYVTESFEQLRYMPLARNFIEQIEIRLADEYGENIRFEWGKVVITLHFRRKKAWDEHQH